MPGPAQFSLLWDRVTWLDPFLVGNVQGVSSKGTRSLGLNKKSDGGELQSPSSPSRGLPFLYILLLKCLARVSWAPDSGSHKACVKTGWCNRSQFLWLLYQLARDAWHQLLRGCLNHGSVKSLEASAARGRDPWIAREWPGYPRQGPGRQGPWQGGHWAKCPLQLQPGYFHLGGAEVWYSHTVQRHGGGRDDHPPLASFTFQPSLGLG